VTFDHVFDKVIFNEVITLMETFNVVMVCKFCDVLFAFRCCDFCSSDLFPKCWIRIIKNLKLFKRIQLEHFPSDSQSRKLNKLFKVVWRLTTNKRERKSILATIKLFCVLRTKKRVREVGNFGKRLINLRKLDQHFQLKRKS
jgi:hypothetical protein